MRIALYHELPSGGAKRALFEIARRLTREHTVDAYTLSSANLAFCDLRPVVRQHRVIPFEPLALFNSPLGRLNQLQRWRDLGRLDRLSQSTAAGIDDQGYDVVVVHASQYTQAPGVLNYLATPSLYQAHEALRLAYEPAIERPYQNGRWRAQLDREDPLIGLYMRRLAELDRRNTLRATRLVTSSKFSADNLRHIYGREATVIYPGIDLDSFRVSGKPQRQDFMLSVGALRPNKGFEFIIRALAQIPAGQRPPLLLVGNADDRLEREYLQSLAQANDVALTIETNIDQASLALRYHQAELVLYAPVNEPLGFVPLEAMACGTVVVAVAEGGVAETVRADVTGVLTRRDPAEFAAAIQGLRQDAERRERLSQAGREQVAREWSWEHSLASLEAELHAAAAHA